MKQIGRHVIADLWECSHTTSEETVRQALSDAVEACQVTLRELLVLPWDPHQGITAMAVLAESHISIHTWPEHGYVAVDIFTCGQRARPEAVVEVVRRAFLPSRVEVRDIPRGLLAQDPV